MDTDPLSLSLSLMDTDPLSLSDGQPSRRRLRVRPPLALRQPGLATGRADSDRDRDSDHGRHESP
jgi:hypothetical protein